MKLNARQRASLRMVSHQYVTSSPAASVVIEKEGGRLTGRYFLTDRGRGVLAAIRLQEASRRRRGVAIDPRT